MKFHDQPRQADSTPSNAPEGRELSRDRIPYQAALRTLGAFLDRRSAFHVNLMEVDGGFIVRYQQSASDAEPVCERFDQNQLVSLFREVEQKRRRTPFGLGMKRDEHGGRYENVFRALGYELDGIEAYSTLVDEVDEGLIVTYQYLKPSESFMAHKRMVFLERSTVERVLNDARDRRSHGGGDFLRVKAR